MGNAPSLRLTQKPEGQKEERKEGYAQAEDIYKSGSACVCDEESIDSIVKMSPESVLFQESCTAFK